MAATTKLSLLVFLSLTATAIATKSSISSSSNTEFIRSSCRITLYPALCFSALSPFASFVNHDPVLLARVAIDLSLIRVRSVAARISEIRSTLTSPRTVAAALKDCAETLSDAADQTWKSSAELKKLQSPATRADVSWHVSNAQTWMSAAITNEDTCVDELLSGRRHRKKLKKNGKSSIRVDISRSVRHVRKYSSNALALVNRLVAFH